MTRRNPCLLGLIDGALIVLALTLAVTAGKSLNIIYITHQDSTFL